MGNIPEVSTDQLRILESMCLGIRTALQLFPDETKDTGEDLLELACGWQRINELIQWGFIEDISHLNKGAIEKLQQENHGRRFRIIQITDMGKTFFGASLSELVH